MIKVTADNKFNFDSS